MAIVHSIFFWSSLSLFMVISTTFYIPIFILHLLKLTKQKEDLIVFLSKGWANYLLRLTGSRVTVEGAENFPDDQNYCIISNHQGDFDIPVIMSIAPGKVAFVAKKELQKVPIVGWWMSTIGVVFLDRSSKRGAVESMNRAAEQVKNGHHMVIFPEGTRSKGGPVAPFKKGSLKLAIKSEATIVPITLDGTYKILGDKGPGLVSSSHARVVVHKPIRLEKFSNDVVEPLALELEEIIKKGLN